MCPGDLRGVHEVLTVIKEREVEEERKKMGGGEDCRVTSKGSWGERKYTRHNEEESGHYAKRSGQT